MEQLSSRVMKATSESFCVPQTASDGGSVGVVPGLQAEPVILGGFS